MELTIPVIAVLIAVVSLFGIQARRNLRNQNGTGDRSYDPAPGERCLHLWGYTDTRFEFAGHRTVRLTGSRYPLAGHLLPRLVPFVEELLEVPLDPEFLRPPVIPSALPTPARNAPFLSELEKILAPDQISIGDEDRLIHSHGQLSVEEIYRIIGGAAPRRIVDAVVFPGSESDVGSLVKLADHQDVVLVPYGGGTNVSGALLCPVDENRMIVSVDMSRMNRILRLDRKNHLAEVQAGITGKDLEIQLRNEGYTCGHIPDSIELSTLGGWIATNASGMKKNRYGNIEDIVREATLVTPRGKIHSFSVDPRSSTGLQPRHLLFGSEGCLGIISSAWIQLRPVPPCQKFASYVFQDFPTGIEFLKAVEASGAKPASLRLTNNTEFRLGRALTPAHSRRQAIVSSLKERYVVGWKGFDPKRMVACTAVLEGSEAEVRHQEKTLLRLCKRFGGLSGGSEGGKRGYRLTFAIAYIRDFLNQLGIIGETFETSAPWDRIEAITDKVEAELYRLCTSHGIGGKPFLSWRISQTYPSGVCIYFTMGFSARGLAQPVETYQKIEHRLREFILDERGSLSHHHGVGKIRRDFVPRVHSKGSIRAIHAVKKALDPNNVFGVRNNIFGLEEPDEE